MTLETGQVITYWAAIVCFLASFLLYATALFFSRENNRRAAGYFVWGGLIFTTVALGFRWLITGRAPYIDFVEVLPGDAWVAVAMFLVLRKWNPKLDFLGMFITPVAFLMLAVTVLSDVTIESVPFTYATYWLYIHIAFAKLAYGSCLISAAMAGLFLWKNRQESIGNSHGSRLPSANNLNDLTHRFAGFGFIMLGIMILTGAVWAHQSWGRYWGWDPIETWALISWFFYGIYLHLRFTFKLSKEKLAWISIFAFVLVIFTYFATPFVYQSIHEHLV